MELNLSVAQLCKTLGVDAPLNSEKKIIRRLTSLEQAEEDDCSVILDRGDSSVFEPINKEKIQQSRAGIILARDCIFQDRPLLLVKDVREALVSLSHYLDEQANLKKIAPSIHPTARIHPSAIIGDESSIGAHVDIGANAVIGRKCSIDDFTKIYPNVSILDGCSIGKHTIIHAGSVIGSDGFGYTVTKQGLLKNPHFGSVIIGNHVEVGAQCAIDRAMLDDTIIEDHVKLDNLIHVAHNVRIGTGTAILALTGIAGGAKIGRGCQIGGQVAIKDHVTIGDGVKIVSKSAVISDAKPGSTLAGQPAEPFLQWKRKLVALKSLPEAMKLFKTFASENKPSGIFTGLIRKWLNR